MSKSIDRSTRDCSNPNVGSKQENLIKLKQENEELKQKLLINLKQENEKLKREILIKERENEIIELKKKISDKQKQNPIIPSTSKYDPQCFECHEKKCEYIRSGKLCQHGRRWKNNYGVCDNFNKCPTW